MLRRLSVGLGATAVGLLGMLAVGGGHASAAPAQISLVVPQGTAFSVLKYDCGGIKELAYVTGFDNTIDPSAGYPTGYVYLTTTCSAGHGTQFTVDSWTADTWDLTGALLSYSVATPNPNPPSPLSATDPLSGNQIYDSASPCPGLGGTGSTAYACLQWGSSFTPRPRVTGISPAIGPAAGGTSVTIFGDGFSAATNVYFGTTAAASKTINSDNSITAVSAVDSSGTSPDTVAVTVLSAGGTSFTSSADQFTFYRQPSITRVSPNHGSIYGGYYVKVYGTNLIGTTGVNAGDTPTAFQVINNTTLSVYIPAGDGGIGDSIGIAVTSPGGSSPNTSADQFTYTAPPSVRVSPSKGVPGTAVKITGANYGGGEHVKVIYLTGLSSPAPAIVTICSATTSPSGAFVCNGRIPPKASAGAIGSHGIGAIGAIGAIGDHASVIFDLT
jgi:IPT/TIG domain